MSTKQAMPEQPNTIELPAVPQWAIEMTSSMKTGFSSVNGRLDSIETYQETQGDTVRDLAKRMTAQEEYVRKFEERVSTNSTRVKNESQTNLKQDSAIVQIIETQAKHTAKIESVEKKTDEQTKMLVRNTEMTAAMLALGKGLLKEHPGIVVAVVAFLSAALGFATNWLNARGH